MNWFWRRNNTSDNHELREDDKLILNKIMNKKYTSTKITKEDADYVTELLKKCKLDEGVEKNECIDSVKNALIALNADIESGIISKEDGGGGKLRKSKKRSTRKPKRRNRRSRSKK